MEIPALKPVKTFHLFGDPLEVLVNSEMSGGASSVVVQTVSPGGGPPPHSHANEDETFIVLEGNFELLSEGQWHPVAKGEVAFGPRGRVHTFRNSGTTSGRILVVAAPAGLDTFLEEISPYSPPADMAKIIEIAGRYGIAFHL